MCKVEIQIGIVQDPSKVISQARERFAGTAASFRACGWSVGWYREFMVVQLDDHVTVIDALARHLENYPTMERVYDFLGAVDAARAVD